MSPHLYPDGYKILKYLQCLVLQRRWDLLNHDTISKTLGGENKYVGYLLKAALFRRDSISRLDRLVCIPSVGECLLKMRGGGPRSVNTRAQAGGEEALEGQGVDRPSKLCVTEQRTEGPEGPRGWTGGGGGREVGW